MSTPAAGSPQPRPVRWGMLSTAAIGRVAATSIGGSGQAQFIAVASRDKARAARFATELGMAHSFGSYEELLAADQVNRIEFEVASHAIATGSSPAFGRADAVDQAAAIEAVRRSAELGAPVKLPAPTAAEGAPAR